MKRNILKMPVLKMRVLVTIMAVIVSGILAMSGICLNTGVQNILTVQAAAGHPSRIVDEADILDDYEEDDLLSMINEISERYQFDVVCVAVDSLNGEDIQYFAADYYDYNGYGMGEDFDGAMFIVSMQERQWYILTTGYAMEIMTDADLADMEDEIIPYLSDGEYAQAFMAFGNACEVQLIYGADDNEAEGSTGDEYTEEDFQGDEYTEEDFLEDEYTEEDFQGDEYTEEVYEEDIYREESAPGIILSVIIGLVLAFVPTLVMRGQLKSVHMQSSAGQYEKHDSRKITVRRDIFLYHTVNRVPKPKDNPNRSGGGSSSFRGSSGRSHGGRGGGF